VHLVGIRAMEDCNCVRDARYNAAPCVLHANRCDTAMDGSAGVDACAPRGFWPLRQ
jgi:hypothetical protein